LQKPRARRHAGFTFIELVIVSAIIGVLAAIAVPALQQARARAVEVAVVSDLKEMARMQELFFVNPVPLSPSPASTDKRYARINELNAFAGNAFGTTTATYSVVKGVVRFEMVPLSPSLASLQSRYTIEARGTSSYDFIYSIDESGRVVRVK
jgi:prepilin-type N-terminal cleavage/methylation domain-containing protein